MSESGAQGPGLVAGLGPVLGGLILDAVDLATFGPIGLKFGLPAGALAGWLLSGAYQLQPRTRWLVAGLSGLYCMLPLTSFIPAATLVAVASRFLGRSAEVPDQGREIEAEYQSEWEEPGAGSE